MGLEASELARWTRFAAKGGIGKCTATCDCVAESTDDLMFLKGDEITVLLQIPDEDNLFLGYCEGVVGHFSGSDVHFHAKLKRPVKAKRASMASGKSPTPSSGINSPIGQPSSPHNSTFKMEAEALERRASQQRRIQAQIPSRVQTMDDEQQRYPPSMTFSSSSNGTDSVVTTPALGYFSSPEIKKSSMYSTPSPRDAQFSIEAPRSKSMPPTRASSPPTVPVSYSQAAMIPMIQQHNIRIPPPLNLKSESTTPLRINKRTPTSPSRPQFSPNTSQTLSPTSPSSLVPDTSYSTYDDTSKRHSIGVSSAEVGIGLSLLQDLANGMDSDSEDGDNEWSKLDHHNLTTGTSGADSYAAALSRVGHRRDSLGEETQESTVEGLGYAQSEENYEEEGEREVAGTGKDVVIVEDTTSQTTSQTTSVATTRISSPNPSIRSNANTSAGHNPNTFLPPLNSPISPSFSQRSFSTNERRPSVVSSAASASEWEGASDIYDDYRYSRYSMASKMSRFSSSAGVGGWAGNGTPPLPDSSSIGRTRTDSNRSRPDSSSVAARSRTDSGNTRISSSASSDIKGTGGGSLLSSLPLLPEAFEIDGGQEPPALHQPRDSHLKRTTIMKERTVSMESAASVYTQNSRLSTLSQDAMAPVSPETNANNHFHNPTSSNANLDDINAHPTPLSPSQPDIKSPLLHTAWSTPLHSPMATIDGPPTGSSAGSGNSDFHTPMIEMVAVARVAVPLGFTEEGRKGSSDMITGSLGGNGGGIASALRQRLETERRSPTLEQTQNHRLIRNVSQTDGLGHRIVIEDDDELPSRILDMSGSSFMSMTTVASPEPIHDEDDEDYINRQDHSRRASAITRTGDSGSVLTSSTPELDIMTHLSPLSVTNRTPSPSVLEGAPEEVRGSRRAGEVEEKDEEEEGRERGKGKESSSTVTPPLNTTTPTPPPPQLSLSPSPAPLQGPPLRSLSTSGATIRTDSPPIELRPPLALSDIREPGGPLVPGSNQRRSLFLPHPNAPKSPGDSVGATTVSGLAGPGPGMPMYIAAQQQQDQQEGWMRGPGSPSNMMMPPARPNVIGVIRAALATPPRAAMFSQGPPGQGGQGPAGQRPPLMVHMRGPTIYGRTETDLAASSGPVPIVFSIDPPHAAIPPSFSGLTPASLAPQATPMSMPSSPLCATVQMVAKPQLRSELQYPARSVSLLESRDGQGLTSAGSGAPTGASVNNVDPSPDAGVTPVIEPKTMGCVIPRANFFPKLPGMRPRSRSFSGFNSTTAKIPLPSQRSQDEAGIPSGRDVKRSMTTSVSSPSPALSLSPVPPTGPGKLAPKLSSVRPSPLSLPHNSVTGGALRHGNSTQPALRSPTSPLSQSIALPPVASSLPASPNDFSTGMGNRSQHQLREMASRSTLNGVLSPPTRPIAIPPSNTHGSAAGSLDSPLASSLPSHSHGRMSIQAQSRNASSRASDVDATSISSDRRSPSVARHLSLRTKLSLPNLRRNRSRQEDESGGGGDSEMLQVQDMEFELIKPNFAHFQTSRASDDSGVLGKDQSLIDVRQDGNAFLRAESPISISSGAGKRSPSMSEPPASSSRGPLSTSNPAPRATTDSESSMDAHRNREIKWMSLMSSNPASQARKSKKVKKLLMDGVPSSVRYLVWSYLTDGKARCVPGVYSQLCSRGRVPSSAGIERDIKSCFQDQPHLQGTQGPVLLLLQAYLNMVPDIQYTMGLTLIVGQLLLLAPEEDAFWIFISIMDTHIRPYFSTLTTQMEVDSALFSRALENNDGQVARKLLVELGITPSTICHPWFSSLFVSTLPPEYLNRIWDLFLFEGIPFLLRVALAIIVCCRRLVLESTSEKNVLQIFHHPQSSLLPPSPDAFLSLVFSVKLKDDDVRKQRVKMEAQIKRQTQTPRTVSTAGGISLPRA